MFQFFRWFLLYLFLWLLFLLLLLGIHNHLFSSLFIVLRNYVSINVLFLRNLFIFSCFEFVFSLFFLFLFFRLFHHFSEIHILLWFLVLLLTLLLNRYCLTGEIQIFKRVFVRHWHLIKHLLTIFILVLLFVNLSGRILNYRIHWKYERTLET